VNAVPPLWSSNVTALRKNYLVVLDDMVSLKVCGDDDMLWASVTGPSSGRYALGLDPVGSGECSTASMATAGSASRI
jgi:hypothetical protein